MDTIHVLGIAGSLRKDSYNKLLLRAAVELAPPEMAIEIYDLAGLPLYNQDEDSAQAPAVLALKARIKVADGLLIATPEYNYSIPGVLKNAIDCASRPYAENAFRGKPVAFLGASVGISGTMRAQYHLRQCCVFLDMHPLQQPEVLVSFCTEKFAADGRFIDEKGRDILARQLTAFAAWINRLKE